MDDLNLIGQNLEVSTHEELLRQARNREDITDTQGVVAVSPTEYVEFGKEFFIEEVRQLSFLWDSSNPSYKNRTVKANAWKKLSDIFNRDGKRELKSHLYFALPFHKATPRNGHKQTLLAAILLLYMIITSCILARNLYFTQVFHTD